MYSEALAILDHNTIVYMVDQQRKEIEDLKALAAEKDSALAAVLSEKEQALAEKECAFLEKEQALAEKEIAFEQIESLQKQIAALTNKR